MMEDKDRILRGIAAYKPMQEEIKQAIRDHGGRLTEDEFDAEFSSFRVVTGKNGQKMTITRPLTISPIMGDSFMLGTINGDFTQQQYLHLAQLMIAADLLDAETEDGVVVYKEAKK